MLKPSTSRLLRPTALALILMLSLQGLALPASAAAQGSGGSSALTKSLNEDATVSEIAKESDHRWFGDAMPWDGGWAAFNSDVSEATGGTCALDMSQTEQVGKLIEALRSDEENIKAEKKQKKDPPSFSSQYKKRLRGEQGMPNAAKPVAIDPAAAKLLPKSASSLADFRAKYYASPNTSGCENKSGLEKLSTIATSLKPGISELLFNPVAFVFKIIASLVAILAAAAYAPVGDWALG